jgi:hypothetical protein
MGLQADKESVVVSKRRSGRGAERLVDKISAATPRATRDRSAARGPTARRRRPSHPLQKFLQRLLREQARSDAAHRCAGGASAASVPVWPAARGPRLRAAASPPLTPLPRAAVAGCRLSARWRRWRSRKTALTAQARCTRSARAGAAAARRLRGRARGQGQTTILGMPVRAGAGAGARGCPAARRGAGAEAGRAAQV